MLHTFAISIWVLYSFSATGLDLCLVTRSSKSLGKTFGLPILDVVRVVDGGAVADSGKVLYQEDLNVLYKFVMEWELRLNQFSLGVPHKKQFSENNPYAGPIFTDFA